MGANSNTIRTVLDRSAYFRSMPAEFRDRIAQIGRVRRCSPNELICGSGEKPTEAWIVLSGGLRASIVTHKGHEFVYGVLGPGSFAGIGTIIENGTTFADLRSRGVTEVLAINGSRFIEELDRNARMWRPVAAMLNYRMRAMAEIIRGLVGRPLAERIARVLLGHKDHFGQPNGRSHAVRIDLSQTDIARMLDSSRSRVNQALKRLEAEGVIEIDYRSIVLRDFDRLKKLAGTEVQSI